MPFKAFYLTAEGDLRRDLGEEEVRAAYESGQGLLWVDVTATRGEDGEFLERTFGFHHLAVEDCLSKRLHSPKIDDFGDYLFIIVHGIDHTAESDIVQTTELALFLGAHFVVSNHNVPLYSVDSVRRLIEDDGRPMRRGADFLAHALIDFLIDNVLPTIDRMTEVGEDVQEEAVAKPQQSTLQAILRLKRSSLRIHRSIAPQREVMNRLARGEFPVIKEEALIFFRDIYDHLVRLHDINESMRDLVGGALDTYLSVINNRMNDIMKTLTVITTLFMPLSFLTGFFGMNFFTPVAPPLQSWTTLAAFGLTLIVMIGTPIGMIFWLRKRGWM
jgi:magnesium transporter